MRLELMIIAGLVFLVGFGTGLLPAQEAVLRIEAEKATLGGKAAPDSRGDDSAGASAHYMGSTESYVEVVSTLPYDVYYVFVRVRAGSYEQPHYGDAAYSAVVDSGEQAVLAPVEGTRVMAGDANNWVWQRSIRALPIGRDGKVRIVTTWAYAMVDVVAIAKDPHYIMPQEELARTPLIAAVKVAVGPVVDGTIDEECWQQAQVVNTFSSVDADAIPATLTEAMTVWTDDALYIAMRCYEADMARLKASIVEQDGPVFQDDSVEVCLNTNGDKAGFFHFLCNSAGVRADGLDYDQAFSWDGVWHSAARRYQDRWEVEIEIPFQTLGGSARPTDVWGINLFRTSTVTDQQMAWSCPFGFPFMPTHLGEMVFVDEALPWLQTEFTGIEVKNNLVQVEIVQPAKAKAPTAEAKLLFQLIDDSGEAIHQEMTMPEHGVSVERCKVPFDLKVAGDQIIQFSLLWGDEIVSRQSIGVHVPPEEFQSLALVSNGFYRQGESACVTALVNVFDRPTEELTLVVSLTRDGELQETRRLAEVQRENRIRFNKTKLAVGDYRVEVTLIDADDTTIAQEQTEFTILHRQDKSSRVVIEEDGVLNVNGKRTFPIVVIFGFPDDRMEQLAPDAVLHGGEWFDWVAELGITLQEARQQFWDKLDRHHERGLMFMPHTCGYFRNREDYDALRRTVAGIKDHPAVSGWFNADEPVGTGTSPRTVRKARDIVREMDADHFTAMVSCQPKAFRLYASTADVFMADPYPVPDRPLKMVSDWTDWAVQAMGDRGPVWMCLQTHGPPVVSRPPTREEFRNMNYQAVVHGALGLVWWSYSFIGGTAGMVVSEYWDEYPRIIGEMKTLEPALINGSRGQLVTLDNGVHYLRKTNDGHSYILAVNVENQPVECGFDADASQINVLFESRQLISGQGRFTDHFDAYGVHVYRMRMAESHGVCN